jgi:hypothetical protein
MNAAANSQKEAAHHWTYMEFASRRAHGKNMDARRDFFLADVEQNASHKLDGVMIARGD